MTNTLVVLHSIPELFLSGVYFKSDLFSLGVCLSRSVFYEK